MSLMARFWSQDSIARDVVHALGSDVWLVLPGALDAAVKRTMLEAEAMSKEDIRALYEAHAAERRSWAADPTARAKAALESLVVRDGVAVISLAGVMMKETPSFALGCCSTNHARLQIAGAEARSDVKSILLNIDSPGGTVSGTDALGQDIRGATKPTHAYAGDLCASAALWAAVQADRFTIGRTAAGGSIGVYTVVDDTSQMFADAGIKSHLVSSGGVKGALEDGIEISDAALGDVQRRIDEIGAMFVSAVAEGRGMTTARVRALATGQVWLGEQLVSSGLADAVETEPQAFKAASDAARWGRLDSASHTNGGTSMNTNATKLTPEQAQAELERLAVAHRKEHPQLTREQAFVVVALENGEIYSAANGCGPRAA